MREIKFRAWDKILNKMFVVTAILFDHEAVYYNEKVESNTYLASTRELVNTTMNNRSASLKDVVLMQSTGVLDKDGTEIYDGDVIQVQVYATTHKGKRPNGVEKRAVCWKELRSYTGFNLTTRSEYLVIGNIYENPELLKEVK